MYTDLMRLVSALVMLPPARQLTTRWMRGLLLLDVLGGTSALALLGILWRTAWRSGVTVWRMLSEHSMERYTYTYVHAVVALWPHMGYACLVSCSNPYLPVAIIVQSSTINYYVSMYCHQKHCHGTGTGVLHTTDRRATVRILALHQPYCPTEVEARWWYSFGETMQNVNKFWSRCGEEKTVTSMEYYRINWVARRCVCTGVHNCSYRHATGTDK